MTTTVACAHKNDAQRVLHARLREHRLHVVLGGREKGAGDEPNVGVHGVLHAHLVVHDGDVLARRGDEAAGFDGDLTMLLIRVPYKLAMHLAAAQVQAAGVATGGPACGADVLTTKEGVHAKRVWRAQAIALLGRDADGEGAGVHEGTLLVEAGEVHAALRCCAGGGATGYADSPRARERAARFHRIGFPLALVGAAIALVRVVGAVAAAIALVALVAVLPRLRLLCVAAYTDEAVADGEECLTHKRLLINGKRLLTQLPAIHLDRGIRAPSEGPVARRVI